MQGDTTERMGGREPPETDGRDLAIQWLHGTRYLELQRLHGARVRVGRGPGNHLRLEHPSVSREHVEFYRQGPIYALRDCGSTNRTHLNGAPTEHAPVGPGDVLRVGEFIGVMLLVPRSSELACFGELSSGLIGGPTLAARLSEVRAAARTDLPVMVVGETGTGKERVARAIHEWSGRSGRFHALNCAALPAELAEAELFGHERGAFTGADRTRLGHLRAAHRGTLFLDEAAELPLSIQAKLLRALEEREIVPLGLTEPVPIDVRVVAAAPQSFESYVAAASFRADLYERLAGFQVEIPPLRSRREDIPALLSHLMRKHAAGGVPTLEVGLLERLLLHAWRGNVRQLELFVRKLLALHGNAPVLGRQCANGILLNEYSAAHEKPTVTGAPDRKEHDRRLLQEALQKHQGNMTAAAASVGISRRRAYRLLDQLENEGSRASTPATNGAAHDESTPVLGDE